jgi:hypothetical protein
VDILDLFQQRLEYIREVPSELEYRCPFCNSEGLKINKVTGKYKLYKCRCNVKRVYPYLIEGSDTPYIPRQRQVPKIVEPVPNLLNIKLTTITNPPLLTDLNNKYSNLDGEVVYKHSNYQRAKRINRVRSTGKKIVIPQVLINGSWVNGIGEGTFPLFTNERALVGELIIAVEGQKCVEYLNYKQIEAISLLGSYTTSTTKIQEVIEISRSLVPNVKQFLYLPDLDVKGMQKADIFQRAMWEIKMPCKVFDLRGELVKSTNFVQGYDIADYITENKDVDLVEVFENEFRRCI